MILNLLFKDSSQVTLSLISIFFLYQNHGMQYKILKQCNHVIHIKSNHQNSPQNYKKKKRKDFEANYLDSKANVQIQNSKTFVRSFLRCRR